MFLGAIIVEVIVLLILIIGFKNKVKVYDAFVEGVKDGFKSVVKIAPYLLTMLFAIDLFRKSGALNLLLYAVRPIANIFGIPEGVIPMIIIKPISGGGALSVMMDIMKTYGPDSAEGTIACVMMGSTETIFYTLTVYFGSIGIKNTKQCLAASLIAHFVGCLAAVYICNLFF